MLNAQSLLKLVFLSAWILTLTTIAFGTGSALLPARSVSFALTVYGPDTGWNHHLVAARVAGVIVHGRSLRHGPASAAGAKAGPI